MRAHAGLMAILPGKPRLVSCPGLSLTIHHHTHHPTTSSDRRDSSEGRGVEGSTFHEG